MTRIFAIAAALSASLACAADRVALVIGNSDYQSQKRLNNPVNDASDVGEMLRKLDFDVIEATNLNHDNMRAKTREFSRKLDDAKVALFFYAGHGMQVSGRNFILPVDADIKSADQVEREALLLDDILKLMQARDRVSIVILDACRDNPFSQVVAQSITPAMRKGEGPGDGLATFQNIENTIIIFATGPGASAADGDGRNSPFTSALLQHASTPGLDINPMMLNVRKTVVESTKGKQSPWTQESRNDLVYLAGGGAAASAPQQLALAAGGGQIRSLTPQVAPNAAPEPAPAIDPGLLCDRLATDQEDPLHVTSLVHVRHVDSAKAIPACQAAVAAAPKTVRYQNQLGRAYVAAKRFGEALDAFRAAADRGSSYATNELGVMYFRGWGGAARNTNVAYLWIQKAANLGVPMSIKNMAYMQAHGLGAPRDAAKAFALLRRWEAQKKNPKILLGLAEMHQDGAGTPQDYFRAREYLKQAADLEDPEAIQILGHYFLNGLGGPKDIEEGRRLIQLAAAYEYPHAMDYLGELFRYGGAGVPQDIKTARDWFQRAAIMNSGQGLFNLAMLYLDGTGVERDVARARGYLEEAVEFDDMRALKKLAELYLDGTFGGVDKQKAISLFQRAALFDDTEARDELANLEGTETSGAACDRLAAAESDPMRPPVVKPVANTNAKKAIPACESAVIASPENLRYANQLARAYIEAEKYIDAHRVLTPALLEKSAFAAMWKGNLHARGLGVAKDTRLGAQWYEKAANLGSADGMNNLAFAYQNGDGVPKDIAQARSWYEKAATAGASTAMYELGNMYFNADGVREDTTLARELYEKSAASGERFAMHQLGVIYEQGKGITADARQARQWYTQAAEKGVMISMRKLADFYTKGVGGERDAQKARLWLEQAAGLDDVAAMKLLAQALLAGIYGNADEPEGRRWLRRAADKGDNDAKRMLNDNAASGAEGASQALLCDRYAGDKSDPQHNVTTPVVDRVDTSLAIPACEIAVKAEPGILRHANQLGRAYLTAGRNFDALRIYKAAAEEGSPIAAIWVGNIYNRGLGVPVNADESVRWFERAAESGLKDAMNNLGVHYIKLWDQNIDPQASAATAISWFKKAADLGDETSMNELAQIYGNGWGVPQDSVKEVEYLLKAVDFGSASAMFRLGMKHASSDGVERDDIKSRELFERASALGVPDATYRLAAMYFNGAGGDKDIARAREFLEGNVKRSHLDSIISLASILHNGNYGEPDKTEMRRLYKLAADLGSEKAREWLVKLDKEIEDDRVDETNSIGLKYFRGDGVPKDEVKAREFFERAALKGHAAATGNLASMYLDGEGGERNPVKAREMLNANVQRNHVWSIEYLAGSIDKGKFGAVDKAEVHRLYALAAEKGSARAKEALEREVLADTTNKALKLYKGESEKKDLVKAREMFAVAAGKGFEPAAEYLARMYLNGEGGSKNLTMARELLDANVKREHLSSMIFLGQALASGKFGKFDKAEARRLYALAAENGSAEAKSLLSKLK